MELYRSYAEALLELAIEENTEDKVFSDSEVLLCALKENPEYASVLDTPALPLADRLNMIDEAFGKMDESLINMVKILAEGGRASLLSAILKEFASLYYDCKGIVRAEAISAVALTGEQISKLKSKISLITGKTVIIDSKVDPTILGGMTVRFLDKQIDGTVAGRLQEFEKRLKDAVI